MGYGSFIARWNMANFANLSRLLLYKISQRIHMQQFQVRRASLDTNSSQCVEHG